MSYGSQSGGPWQRSIMQGQQPSGGFHQNSQVYMQSNMAAFGHGVMQGGNGNMFPGVGGGGGNSISYPQPRSGLNPVAFQQGGSGQSQYNGVGTVTKISSDCGLINDEIFFYRNVCKGPTPILGDRVVFEAVYSNNGQFKWNASHVQLMQQSQSLMGSNKGNYSSVGPPNEYQRGQLRRNSPKRSPVRGRPDRIRDKRLRHSRDREEAEHERKKRREDDRTVETKNRGSAVATAARKEKDRNRGEPVTKGRDVEREDREKEKKVVRDLEIHRAGPKERQTRNRKRYMVKIPKSLLTIKTADIQDVRQRYTPLYIPSDFFFANLKWSDTFTPDNPFSLRRPCKFHIMHEVVESPNEQNTDLLEPADASYLYSAKVMLLSLPPIADIYKKCFDAEEDIDHHAVHPSRLINFLVGVKGGVGSMAIGGPWSASLDGENPDKDPSVLIRTAIRTCKALTGIDLSNCTQWYRFVELFYHRTEYKNMEKDGPPRVETVVIYIPDVHSCMPSIEEWQTLTQVYKNSAEDMIARRSELVDAANTNSDNDKPDDTEMADNAENSNDNDDANNNDDNDDAEEEDEGEENEAQGEEDEEEKIVDSTVSIDLTVGADDDTENGDAEEEDQTIADNENVTDDMGDDIVYA